MDKICDAPNCKKESHARGKYCAKHGARLRRNGSFDLPAKLSLKERLLAKTQIDEKSGCWNWVGYQTNKGRYGAINNDGKRLLVHRVSYEIHKGEIPDGMLVCHNCDNMTCVNPQHLWLGSNNDNMQDKMKKGRHRVRADCKYTKEEILAVKDLIKAGFSTYFIAKKFNEKYGVLAHIIRRC